MQNWVIFLNLEQSKARLCNLKFDFGQSPTSRILRVKSYFMIVNIKKILSILFLVVLATSVSSFSASAQKRQDSEKKDDETIPFKDMWSVRTNALEWLLTIPNLGVEFDLSNSIYNRSTVGMNVRYNWNTTHNYTTPMVFNVFELRPEYRYYWRVNDKLAVGKWIREKIFKDKTLEKTWRAYYFGGYANAGTYSFKFGKEGRQGQMYGLGVVAGYSVPLYSYKKSVIDVEFGFSLGLAATTYKAFGHNPNGDYYYEITSRSKGFHVVPYPVVSELKVAFVYRMRSIDDKYKKEDQKEIIRRQQEDLDKAARMDSVATAKENLKKLKAEEKAARLDSLAKVKELKKSGEWVKPEKPSKESAKEDKALKNKDKALKNNDKTVDKASKSESVPETRPVKSKSEKKSKKAKSKEAELEALPGNVDDQTVESPAPTVKESDVQEKTISKSKASKDKSAKSRDGKKSRKEDRK